MIVLAIRWIVLVADSFSCSASDIVLLPPLPTLDTMALPSPLVIPSSLLLLVPPPPPNASPFSTPNSIDPCNKSNAP